MCIPRIPNIKENRYPIRCAPEFETDPKIYEGILHLSITLKFAEKYLFLNTGFIKYVIILLMIMAVPIWPDIIHPIWFAILFGTCIVYFVLALAYYLINKFTGGVDTKLDYIRNFIMYKRCLKNFFRKTWWEIDMGYPEIREVSGPFDSLEKLREFRNIREIIEG